MKLRTEMIDYSAALSLFLSVVENSFPHPLPFLRIGLANCALLMASRVLGMAEFALLCFFKTFIQLFLSGMLFTEIALMTVGFNITAFAVMLLFRHANRLSFVGVSCVSAFCANAVQGLIMCHAVLGKGALPVAIIMLLVGNVSALLTGLAANFLFPAYCDAVAAQLSFDRAVPRFKLRAKSLARLFAVMVMIVFFALLVPSGKVLFSIGGFRVTMDALRTGCRKALLVLFCYIAGVAFRSFAAPRSGFVARIFGFYGALWENFSMVAGDASGSVGSRVREALDISGQCVGKSRFGEK